MQKIKSKDQVILDIFYVKKLSNLIRREKFGLKLKTQIVKLIEISERLATCMATYTYAKKQHHNSIQSGHRYCRFNIGNIKS